MEFARPRNKSEKKPHRRRKENPVDFTYDRCQEGDVPAQGASEVTGAQRDQVACQLGLHRCAAVLQSGRTCHGNHPGIGCRYTDKHAVPEEANPEESPVQRKMKMKEPEDQSEAKRARVHANTSQEVNVASSPSYVEDDSIMKRMLPTLREERNGRRGNMEPSGELVSHFPKQPQHPPPQRDKYSESVVRHSSSAGYP